MSKQRVAMCPQPFDLDKEEAAARVCYVQSGEAKGSGLLVEWNGRPCIITNNHVLENEEHAKNATVLFNYRRSKDTASKCRPLDDPDGLFVCSPFSQPMNSALVDAHHLDYTLVEVEAADVAKLSDRLSIKPLVLWPTFEAREDQQNQWYEAQACVIGHPGGDARRSQQGNIKRPRLGNKLIGTHLAVTEGGSSGSPVFHNTHTFPLLGLHYWGDASDGLFVCLDAIVTDLMRLEIINRFGNRFDPSDPDHVCDAAQIAASYVQDSATQAEAFKLLDEQWPSGHREGLIHTRNIISQGIFQICGDAARGGGLIELRSLTILPESDPWTEEDQKAYNGGNSSHGETKIGVIIYRSVDGDRQGEIIISDCSKIENVPTQIGTAHAQAFKHVVGRDPRSGDVGCGFAYNDKRSPGGARNLVFGSLTFNMSGQRGIDDAFHGMTNGNGDDRHKKASNSEQTLVRRIWEMYKKGPPYEAVAATPPHVPAGPPPVSAARPPTPAARPHDPAARPPIPAARPHVPAGPPPVSAVGAGTAPSPADIRTMSIGRLKQLLSSRHVPLLGITEKFELVELALGLSSRHVPLHCSQGLLATYLPADPSDPRYKGYRQPLTAPHHVHYRRGMHPDGAGAPFPLRSEVEGQAAWLDLSRACIALAGNVQDWWFDFGPDTVARVLEFTQDGHDWSALPLAKIIHGEGQWKNSPRPSRAVSGVVLGEGVWEIYTSSGWKPLTKNKEVLKKIEEDYCIGRAHLDYSWSYRQDCGCLARQRVCSVTKEDHGPEGIRSHMYYVDFDQTIQGGHDGQTYFRQVDLWYTLDVRRQPAVRRRSNPDFAVLRQWRNQCPELRSLWDEHAPVTEWRGVALLEASGDAHRRVVQIRLSREGLTGEVPASLGELTALTVLHLDNNHLTGQLPPALGGLTALRTLWIQNNQLSGKVPPQLKTRLVTAGALNLNKNQLSGEGGQTTKADRVVNAPAPSTPNHPRTSAPAPMPVHQSDLGVIRLWRNQSAALRGHWNEQLPVKEWQGIKFGEAGGDAEGRVIEISLVTQGLTDMVPAAVGNLAALINLNLARNRLLGVSAEIGLLRSLKFLDLSKNQLTSLPAALGGLSSLTCLYLGGNMLKSAPEWLGGLSSLIELDFCDNYLTSVPNELGRLAKLTLLHLYGNQLTSIPAALGNLAALKMLSLDGNELTSLPAELKGLSSLKTLDVCRNQLTSVPRELGRLTSLKKLDLRNNPQLRYVPVQLLKRYQEKILKLYLDDGVSTNTTTVSARSNAGARSNVICRNIRSGSCTFGDNCRFSHVV